jgi:hypothetical protein
MSDAWEAFGRLLGGSGDIRVIFVCAAVSSLVRMVPARIELLELAYRITYPCV